MQCCQICSIRLRPFSQGDDGIILLRSPIDTVEYEKRMMSERMKKVRVISPRLPLMQDPKTQESSQQATGDMLHGRQNLGDKINLRIDKNNTPTIITYTRNSSGIGGKSQPHILYYQTLFVIMRCPVGKGLGEWVLGGIFHHGQILFRF